MATYTQRTHNIANNEINEITLTDQQVIDGTISWRVSFSADKTTITGDGTDTAVITAQLVSAPLTNDSQVNIAQSIIVIIDIDGEEHTVTLDENGAFSVDFDSVASGSTVAIKATNYPSNILEIEVT